MPTTFNGLLAEAGIDPKEVRLLRHADTSSARGRTPYHLWLTDRATFDAYQRLQSKAQKTRASLASKYWASFVGTPEGETLFVGVYRVRRLGLLPEDRAAPHRDGIEKAGSLDEYELDLDDRLRDRIGRLYVEWGDTKKRAWIQHADLQDKLIDDGPRSPASSRRGVATRTWLKTIGHGDKSRRETWTRPEVHFTARMPGKGIRVGDTLVLYAAGQHADGRHPIFALAEVTSPVRPNEVNGEPVKGEDPFICAVRYVVNRPTAEGVPLAEIASARDLGDSIRQKSYIELKPHESASARSKLLLIDSAGPDELPLGGTYREGASKTVVVNAYERDPRCRDACLARHGTSCFVCGLSFGTVYGTEFEGRIHVHHLDPVSTLGGREVDPVRDLRPVCPNCHYVIHLRTPPYTPEEVAALLKRAR